jgi:hypothetical protein
MASGKVTETKDVAINPRGVTAVQLFYFDEDVPFAVLEVMNGHLFVEGIGRDGTPVTVESIETRQHKRIARV